MRKATRHRAATKRSRPSVEVFEQRLLLNGSKSRPAAPSPRNMIIFVADGLRPGSVNPTDAPMMTQLRKMGVNFTNSHALFPTFTSPNASAIATGHTLGDTGIFSNTLFSGYPVLGGTNTPFVESDPVLGDIDMHFGGNALDEQTLLAFARSQGYSTAAIGKQGPTLIQDITQGNPANGAVPVPQSVIVDDSTGRTGGIPLSATMTTRMLLAGLSLTAPDRSNGASTSTQLANGNSGNNTTPGTLVANLVQQQYFADVTTKAILPMFRDANKPFALVFWARDPDGTQHNQGDSLNSLTPGINGPTSRMAVHNTDNNLKQIYDFLMANPKMARNTEIFVTADHGFSTISRNAVDNAGAKINDYASTQSFAGVNPGFLPPGFVAIDIAHALNLPLFDPDTIVTVGGQKTYNPVDPTIGQRPRNGDGLIGGTGAILASTDAQVVVAANGGSDLIYVPNRDPALVRRIADYLSKQDYTSGLIVDDAFGPIPGTIPASAAGLKGSTLLPLPAIFLNFKSFATNPADPVNSTVEIADTGLQQGQGMHGSFSRADTFNNMLAFGPDFKRGLKDTLPVSNADIATTLAAILNFQIPAKGLLTGRVITEALAGRHAPLTATSGVLTSDPAANGQTSVLQYQQVGNTRYYDVLGFPGRSVGLTTPSASIAARLHARSHARKAR